MEKITIATIPRSFRRTPTSLEYDLLLINPNPSNVVNIAFIKWDMSFYDFVLSNPKLININPLFVDYMQVLDIYELNPNDVSRARLYLLAKKSNVPFVPSGLTALATLRFDRELNMLPTGVGVDNIESCVIANTEVPSQISII